LDNGRFIWPSVDATTWSLNSEQFFWPFAGVDWQRLSPPIGLRQVFKLLRLMSMKHAQNTDDMDVHTLRTLVADQTQLIAIQHKPIVTRSSFAMSAPSASAKRALTC